MEVVGLSAGLVSLALQLADGTRKLRDAYKLTGSMPSKLDRLTDNLNLLQHVAELLGRSNIPSTFRNGIIASSLEEVTKELDRLSKRVAKVESSKKLALAARRVWHAPSFQDELKHLEGLIHSAESKMLLGLAVLTTQQMLPPPDVSSGAGAPETQQHSDGASSDTHSSHMASPSRLRKPLSGRFHGCAYRKCQCRCHTQGSAGGRFWGVQYTPLSMILSDCDRPRCNARLYKVSFRIAFSQFGLKWAVTAAAGIRSGGGSYSLDVSLRPQHIVRFTSDGFLLLFNILMGLIGLEDGIASFKALRESDPSIIDHVNPAGRGYIEELLMRPSGFERQDALLRLFMKDFGMEKGLHNVSLLYSCMNWIGEGPHIALFDTLFELGYDPSMVESPRPELWPKPSDPNWMSEEFTPDPFFIEMMSEFVELDPGFGGTSDLQYEILRHPAQAFQNLANPMYTLDQSPNFLGQTPLHLAVVQSNVVLALLEADHSVDAVDIFGLTPLMYAAGLGKIEAAKRLISAGADVNIKCGRFQRDFTAYAFARGHLEFIVETILHLQSTNPLQSCQLGRLYGTVTLLRMVKGAYLPSISVEYLDKLVQLAGDAKFTFDDPNYSAPEHEGAKHNHLLHYGWPLQHVKVIMKSALNLLKDKNDIGGTALMSAASHGNPLVTQYLIEMGAEVSEHDSGGMSALTYCLWGWARRDGLPFGYQGEASYPKVARILLNAGADPCSTDDCDCACSTSGCTVTHMFPAFFRTGECFFMDTHNIWTALEWIHLLEDRQNEEVLRSGLTSLLRRSLFEELGMSHTCCRRGRKLSTISALLFDGDTPTEEEGFVIRAQQMQKSEQLDLQMQRMANLSTAELMYEWQKSVFQCHLLVSRMDCPSWLDGLKVWYEHTRDLTNPKVIFGPLERSKPSGKYSVNESRDSITRSFHWPASQVDKELPFSSSLDYLENLEQAYYEGGVGYGKGDRDAWYKRRLGWVLQFLEVLHVPQLYVRAGLQWRLTNSCGWLDGKDPSDVMKHFLDSRKEVLAHKM